MEEPILSVNLDAFYGHKQVLSGVAFDLMEGDILGLMGTSGAGKSTVVLSLFGLLPWRGGRASGFVRFKGRNLFELPERELRKVRGKEIAMVPQSPLSALNPALSLQKQFKEAWLAHQQPSPAALEARCEELLHEVDLPCSQEFLRSRPSQISVGQAQRVVIALALLHRPAVLIADEPTSALDPITQIQINALLRRLSKKENASMLYVSHDLMSVLRVANRMATLDGGTIVETLPLSLLSQAKNPKTRSLLATLPVPTELMLSFIEEESLKVPDGSAESPR